VKDELRENLIARLRAKAGRDDDGDSLFPGIVGYEDTVVPQLVNAVLSRHNFILLGLRGQAKSRILRALTTLLDSADALRGRVGGARQPVRADLEVSRAT
jgi:magnesium chelatase subunit I